MIRKFYISTLLCIFLVSTTGLPLTLHICSMNGLVSTESCKTHKVMEEEHSCCSKDDESPVKITLNEFDGCCQFKVIERNVTDQFVPVSSDISQITHLKILLSVSDIVYNTPLVLAQYNYTSGSPPPLSDNHIYLDNSILLI